MRIRSFKRHLAPVMHPVGDADDEGRVPVISVRDLRRIAREKARRARKTTPADRARMMQAEAKREARRTRNLQERR